MNGTAFDLTLDESTRTLRVAGDIEGDAARQFEAALLDLLGPGSEGGGPVGGTVDLSAVTYLPSAATGPLMVAVRDARRDGVSLRLYAEAGTIADRVLLTMGVEHDSGPA